MLGFSLSEFRVQGSGTFSGDKATRDSVANMLSGSVSGRIERVLNQIRLLQSKLVQPDLPKSANDIDKKCPFQFTKHPWGPVGYPIFAQTPCTGRGRRSLWVLLEASWDYLTLSPYTGRFGALG